MRSIKNSFNVKDEYNTPSVLVNMVIPYLKKFEKSKNKKITIECPFDKKNSQYVKILKENQFNVLNSHIDDGKDFFNISYKDNHADIVVSNPPFSKKIKIFEKLIEENMPFMLLMNMMAINYQEIGECFYKAGVDLQFIIPDKKISFDGKTSSFCSGYVCYKVIDKTLFEHLENNNSGKFYKK